MRGHLQQTLSYLIFEALYCGKYKSFKLCLYIFWKYINLSNFIHFFKSQLVVGKGENISSHFDIHSMITNISPYLQMQKTNTIYNHFSPIFRLFKSIWNDDSLIKTTLIWCNHFHVYHVLSNLAYFFLINPIKIW